MTWKYLSYQEKKTKKYGCNKVNDEFIENAYFLPPNEFFLPF